MDTLCNPIMWDAQPEDNTCLQPEDITRPQPKDNTHPQPGEDTCPQSETKIDIAPTSTRPKVRHRLGPIPHFHSIFKVVNGIEKLFNYSDPSREGRMRKSQNLTKEDVAMMLGIKPQTISHWNLGKKDKVLSYVTLRINRLDSGLRSSISEWEKRWMLDKDSLYILRRQEKLIQT